MTIEINGKAYKLSLGHFVYALILFLFSTYILRDLSYNTAFVDEAIYATVGEEFLRGIFWESALSWMGGSYLYPILSALINRSLGLAGIRAFSFFCVFVAGISAGEIAKKLGGQKARTFAVFLFFSSASVLNLASLGTYDTSAILFLSLSALSALYSQSKKVHTGKAFIILSSLFFLLSVLSKYISIVFLPFLALLVLAKSKKDNTTRLVLWAVPFMTLFSGYVLFTASSLLAFFTSDSFVEIKSRLFILTQIFGLLNIFLVSVIALPILLRIKRKNNHILITLFMAGLMPLSYHVLFANYRSLWKHVVFTQFFWAPIVGVLLVVLFMRFNKYVREKELVANASQLIYSVVIAAGVFGVWLSASAHWRFQRSWPSANAVLDYLAMARKPGDKIFAEGSAVYKYHLFDGFEDPLSWTSTWYIEYQGATGIVAMRKAIKDQTFDYIVLNGYYTQNESNELTQLANIYYEKVLTDNYKVSGEYDTSTFVWTRKGN